MHQRGRDRTLEPADCAFHAGFGHLLQRGDALGRDVFQNASGEAVGPCEEAGWADQCFQWDDAVGTAQLDFRSPPGIVQQLELVTFVVATEHLSAVALANIEGRGKSFFATRVIKRWLASTVGEFVVLVGFISRIEAVFAVEEITG